MNASTTTSPMAVDSSRPPSAPHSAAASLVGQAIDGLIGNTLTITKFTGSALVEDDPVGTVRALRGMIKAAQDGDLSQPEAILMLQALSLDAIFGNLARRAADSISTDIGRSDRLLRLALKAQAQSRASLETLITAKNPPVVIARQANISAGHQQVNNGGMTREACNPSDGAELRAEKFGSTPIKVLEDTGHVERMDAGTSLEAGCCDQDVEALGRRDGTAHVGRESSKLAQC